MKILCHGLIIGYMENAMASSTSLATPPEEVDALIQVVIVAICISMHLLKSIDQTLQIIP